MRGRPALIAAIAAAVAASAAAPAGAARLTYEQAQGTTTITLSDTKGEVNSLAIERLADGSIKLTETGAGAVFEGGDACPVTQVRAGSARTCPPAGSPGATLKIVVELGGGATNALVLAKSVKADFTVVGGTGSDAVNHLDGPGTLNADLGAGSDIVASGSGADTIKGGDGRDLLSGGAGADTIEGGGGDADSIDGGPGGDAISGGPGIDDGVDYTVRTAAVRVTLADDGATDGEAGEGDDVRGDVESVLGGAGADSLTGNAGANLLDGRDGNDEIAGGDGGDVLLGSLGNDRLDSDAASLAAASALVGTSSDSLDGGPGDDALRGGDGVDTQVGGPGNDSLDGRSSFPSYADTDEVVQCGEGADTAALDWNDVPKDCEVVHADVKPIDATPPPPPPPIFKPPGPGPLPPLGPPVLKGRTLSLPVYCAGRRACRVTILVRSARTPVKPKSRRLKPARRLGSKRASVAAGKTGTVQVNLSGAGAQAVRRKESLVIEITIKGSGRAIRTKRPLPIAKEQLGQGGDDKYAEIEENRRPD